MATLSARSLDGVVVVVFHVLSDSCLKVTHHPARATNAFRRRMGSECVDAAWTSSAEHLETLVAVLQPTGG